MTAQITEKLAKLDPEDLIIDSTFNVLPRQRNTKEENEAVKAGKGEDLWKNQKHKKSHKDTDARWTKKRNETFFGYKIHRRCGCPDRPALIRTAVAICRVPTLCCAANRRPNHAGWQP